MALESAKALGSGHGGSNVRYLAYLLANAQFKAESFEDCWAALKTCKDKTNMRKDSVNSAATGEAMTHFHLDVMALQVR